MRQPLGIRAVVRVTVIVSWYLLHGEAIALLPLVEGTVFFTDNHLREAHGCQSRANRASSDSFIIEKQMMVAYDVYDMLSS